MKMFEAVEKVSKRFTNILERDLEWLAEDRVEVSMDPPYVGSETSESVISFKVRLLPELTREEKIEAVAKRFIDAGYGNKEIRERDLEVIGVGKVPDDVDGWEEYCSYIYKQLTGEECPESGARGRGFRSQYYGEEVAKAIRNVFAKVDA